MGIKSGTYGVLLTPFSSEGTVDEALLRKELTYCNGTRTTGLFPCGSTGEFVYMDLEQKKNVLRITMEMAEDKVLVGGASGATEQEVLHLLQYMASVGYRYAMICPPYYYPQTPEDVLAFFSYISRNAPEDLSLLLYNIPFCTSEIYLSVLEKIMALPNVIGMKDSSGNMLYMNQVINMAAEKHKEFSVFTGQDMTISASMAAGACGCMSALSWIVDEPGAYICKAFRDQKISEVKHVQDKLNRLVVHLSAVSFPENYRMLATAVGIDTGKAQRHLNNLNDDFYSQWAEKTRFLVDDLRVEIKEIKKRIKKD